MAGADIVVYSSHKFLISWHLFLQLNPSLRRFLFGSAPIISSKKMPAAAKQAE
jgi:hypothetical protein